MRRRLADLGRWAVPLGATILLMFMLARQSRQAQILGRYSPQYALLLVSLALLAATCWWVALDRLRFKRLTARAWRPAIFVLLIAVIALAALFDIFQDLRIAASLVPLMLAGLVLLMAHAPPGSRLDAVLDATAWNQLVLAICGMLAALILVEVTFRLLLVQRLVPQSERDFAGLVSPGWPHAVSPAKADGVYRILGLSDSFGQMGGHQNYNYLIENLAQESGLSVEMVNFSVSGYEPADQLALLRRFGRQYQPDLVLHGFFVGNDFNLPTGPLLRFQGIQFRPQSSGNWALHPRNSWVLRWLKNYITFIGDRAIKQREATAAQPSGETPAIQPGQPSGEGPPIQPAQPPNEAPTYQRQPAAGVISEEAFLRVERRRLDLFSRDPSRQVRWPETLALIDQIRAEAAAMGSDYALVIHPDRFQVEESVLAELQARYGFDLAQFDLGLAQRYLLAYCAQYDLTCLDLLPALANIGSQGGLFLPNDSHYNEAGNQLVAELILAALRGSLILPSY